MSEPLIWRDAWELGITLLDEQHREMVRLLNALFDDRGPRPVTERLDALIAHLRRHFHAEDVFLCAIGFPDRDEHIREHMMELAELVGLRRALSRTGAEGLDLADEQAIRHWFFNHVIAEDRRYGDFYRDVVCGR